MANSGLPRSYRKCETGLFSNSNNKGRKATQIVVLTSKGFCLTKLTVGAAGCSAYESLSHVAAPDRLGTHMSNRVI